MRIISTLITVATLAYGYMWFSKNYPTITDGTLSFVSGQELTGIRPIYTPEQVLDRHATNLTRHGGVISGDPDILYVPVLLLNVKYADTFYTTGEGVLLFDLLDGEMILNINTLEKTHGLADCLRAQASKHECKVISLMAKKGGQLGRESIKRGLRVDMDLVDEWVDNCRQKKLIVPSGNGYRLHMQNPRLPNSPVTYVDNPLTTFRSKRFSGRKPQFDTAHIPSLCTAFFGSDFGIKTQEIAYLPIYRINVEGLDKDITTLYFNSISGKPIPKEAINF